VKVNDKNAYIYGLKIIRQASVVLASPQGEDFVSTLHTILLVVGYSVAKLLEYKYLKILWCSYQTLINLWSRSRLKRYSYYNYATHNGIIQSLGARNALKYGKIIDKVTCNVVAQLADSP